MKKRKVTDTEAQERIAEALESIGRHLGRLVKVLDPGARNFVKNPKVGGDDNSN